MVCSNFSNFYLQHAGIKFTNWDLELHRKKKEEVTSDRVVNIANEAERVPPPEEVRQKLDHYITSEIYEHLTRPKEKFLDPAFLKERKFCVVKNHSDSRVLYHQLFPNWMIKISPEATRFLPMEAPYRERRASIEKRRSDVMYPLRNTNLLRAKGKEHFHNQVSRLPFDVRKYFGFVDEYIYNCPHAAPRAPDHQRYFSVSKKCDVFSPRETLEIISSQPKEKQILVAELLCTYIEGTGQCDPHRGNWVLKKGCDHWCFVSVDNENIGFHIDDQDTGAHLLDPDEQVVLGLLRLRDVYCRKNGLLAMAETVEARLATYLHTHPNVKAPVKDSEDSLIEEEPFTNFQTARLVFLVCVSIIFPLLPLILLIGAVYVTYRYESPPSAFAYYSEVRPCQGILKPISNS